MEFPELSFGDMDKHFSFLDELDFEPDASPEESTAEEIAEDSMDESESTAEEIPKESINESKSVEPSRISQKNYWRPRNPYQLTRHKYVVGVLSIEEDGYTLTNGRTSISRDGDNFHLEEDIRNLMLKKLFVMGSMERINFKRFRWMLPEERLKTDKKMPCRYCRRTDCHRWNATICGIARIIPLAITPPIWHKAPLEKQVTRHFSSIAISITKDGFTISDGKLSISMDGYQSDRSISKCIDRFKVRRIYAVDGYTVKRCEKMAQNFQIFFTNVRFVLMKPWEAGKCIDCQRKDCHRWRATIGGISRVIKFPLDPIRH